MRLHRELARLVILAFLLAFHAALPAREPDGHGLPRVLWTSRNLILAAPSGTVRVYGTFSDGDEVTADGVALSTTYINQSTLEATFTSDQLALPASFELRVRNNHGQSTPYQALVASPRYGVLLGGVDVVVPETPLAIDTALLNGDQRRDLIYITGGPTPQLWAALNNGAGFDPAVAVSLTNDPTSFAVGDVDNDQHDDLLVNHGSAGIVSVFRNDGNGAFSLLDEVAAGHSTAPTIATGDFNGDGRLDFAVGNTTEGSVGVHLANGDDTWSSEPPVATVSNPAYPAVADFNQDGHLDVIVISTTTGALIRHMGNGTGTLAASVAIPVTVGTNAMMVVDDVNGDGVADIITSRLNAFFSPQLLRLDGNGDGTFDAATTIALPIAPLPTAIAVVDVNNDNQVDLVETDGLSSLHILRGDGAGGFSFWTTLTTGFHAAALATADLSGDGKVDFVVGGQDTSVFPFEPHLSVMGQQDPGPRPRLVFPDATFAELNGTRLVSMPVLLRDEDDQPVASTVQITVTLEFIDGTAQVNFDYSLSPASSFPIDAGVTEGEIQFRLRGDTIFEPTETFSIRIKTTTDGALVGDDTAIVTITDDDPPPPAADLAALLVMDGTFAPGVPITGTVTLRNHGPADAAQAGVDLPLQVENPGKLASLQVTNSTFAISVVDQGRIKAGSLVLPAGTESTLSFSATPAAAARTFSDHVAIGGNLSNPAEFVQPNSLRNLGSAAGRMGVGFDQDGDGKVNDVLFYDPGPHALRLVHDVDGGAASQTHTIALATAFAGYTVSDMDVCRRGGSAVPSVVMSLVRNPGGSGDRSIVVAHDLPASDPVGSPYVSLLPNLADKTVTSLKCVDLNNDTRNDVAALFAGSAGILVSLDGEATLSPIEITLSEAISLAADFDVSDFNNNSLNDLVVIEQATGSVFVLLDVANGASAATVSALNVADLFDSQVIAGGFDPVTQSSVPMDFNADGFGDAALLCANCGAGGGAALLPLLNAGTDEPGRLKPDQDAPLTIRHGEDNSDLFVFTSAKAFNNKIIATESDGHVIELTNTTPASSTVASFDVNITRQCGSGLSGIVPVNLFNDAATDHLYTGCFGRILTTLAAGSATDDPNPANDGEETRVIGLTNGPPSSFTIDVNGQTVIPGTVSSLHNTAADTATNSLNGALVSIVNDAGDSITAKVLWTTDDTVTFQWPLLSAEFTAAVPLTLVATTPGGNGASSAPPVIPDPGLPVVSINDGIQFLPYEGGDEHLSAFTFHLDLSAPSPDPVTVAFKSVDGTAIAGFDYVSVTGSVTIDAGETRGTIKVVVSSDAIDELDETFFVNLTAATGATLGDVQGMATIPDDDKPPVLQLEALSTPEGDGTNAVPFTVNLVDEEGLPTTSGKTIVAQVTTTNQSAIAGADFNLLGDTLSFAPGAATASIGLEVIGNTVFSLDKTLLINLAATNATAPASSTFTIVNDDPMPSLSIQPTVTGPEGSGHLRFTVTLSAPSEEPVAVDFDTFMFTATESDGESPFPDYAATAGRLTFAPGETTKSIDVRVFQDLFTEDDETFEVGLLNAVGATVANATALGTIVDDEDGSIEDLSPPTIDPHADVSAFAQSAAGAQVVYALPTASDNTGVTSIACVPSSGSQFPIGATVVTCTAEDAAGNTAQSAFSVTVNVGTPSIAGRIAAQGVASPGVQFFDVELENNGTGTALALQATAFQFRLPTGRTLPLNGLTGALPIAVGDLEAGEKRMVRVYLDLPAAFNRLQLIVNGTFTDVLAAPRSFMFNSIFNVIR